MPLLNRESFQDMLLAIHNLPPRVRDAAATQRPAYQLDEVDEQILDALMEHGPALTSETRDRIDKSARGLMAHLRRLEKHRLVTGTTRQFRSTTRKEWTITDEGRRAAVTPNPEVWQAKGA